MSRSATPPMWRWSTCRRARSRAYILVGKRSWGITLSRDEKTLYVANGFGDDITIIDVDEPQGDDLDPGRPHSLGRGDR